MNWRIEAWRSAGQGKREGNLNTILLMVMDWSIKVGEIFLEARNNRTWKRVSYEGGKGEDLIKDDSGILPCADGWM